MVGNVKPHFFPPTRLTHREQEIMQQIIDGCGNKQIAYNLNLSDQTIKNQVSTILRKLNVNNRAHAVAYVLGYGAKVEGPVSP